MTKTSPQLLRFKALTFHVDDEVVLLLLLLSWCGSCEYNVQQVWLWDVDTTQSAILSCSSTDADVLSRRLVDDVTVRHVTSLCILPWLTRWRHRRHSVVCSEHDTSTTFSVVSGELLLSASEYHLIICWIKIYISRCTRSCSRLWYSHICAEKGR